MICKDYLPAQMGTMSLDQIDPVAAGSVQSLTFVYTAGDFGIDDTGGLRVCWRTTSDMGKPQFSDPEALNYTTIEASNGAKLEYSVDRSGVRPWANSLTVRVGRGFLRKGETITIRMGDRRAGSPGIRLQTAVEHFQFKTLVDAFATNQYTELPLSPHIRLVPGEAVRWRASLPSQNILGESFRLCIAAEDIWGNPTAQGAQPIRLNASARVAGLPEDALPIGECGTLVVDGLKALKPGDLRIDVQTAGDERVLCTSTPARIVESAAFGHFWGDLHGQSGETIGTNPVRGYFLFGRDKAFLDVIGHQGNDFQITDGFWAELNALTAELYEPGRFVTFPGYEWSGNTGMGGDRNVFYRREGRPIHRSSRILVDDAADADCYTAGALFDTLAQAREDAVVIAHVGGRYADLGVAHDGRLERAVEIHSSWGTFEWLLHDAFDLGHRPGIVCHSDDHKGRQGATQPGASTFGAIGGLTCYLATELTRDGVFDALRARRQYGTTGTRLYMNVNGTFDAPVTIYADDPLLGATESRRDTRVLMGAVVAPNRTGLSLDVDVSGSAPIERIDIFHGKEVAETFRPYTAADLGRRIRVMWSGAEYRGRGRETSWTGKARLSGNRIEQVKPINFLNPQQPLSWSDGENIVSWKSVTTGNMAGFDVLVEDKAVGHLAIETNLASLDVDLASLGSDERVIEAGGLARRLRAWRLPEKGSAMSMRIRHRVEGRDLQADLPVYVRVTQEDGHQAWSSPIYLIP
ncbi:DUF3604 domain-containing protein [Bradyrhizobium liaoningense]